ncbi:MAG: glucosaminidase domain-containing protein [Bacteroidota bacterium]
MFSLRLPSAQAIKDHILLLFNYLQNNATTILLCILVVYLLVRKNITVQFSLNNDPIVTTATATKTTDKKVVKASFSPSNRTLSKEEKIQLAYVKRFAKVAQGEMHKYGIPASITLAQGLLESQAGKSPLASKNNNHFGIKCFSKKCQKGHCRNFSDDSHKDFFRVYKTAWESYRAHSEFLHGKRYRHLLRETDYKTWAHGLVKAGYATDPAYGRKLIRLIEQLELDKFDN